MFFEQAIIDATKPEYNVRKIASSNYGLVTSEETRKKLSAAKKGRRPNNYGTHASEERKKKTREKLKGVPLSDSHKANISKAKKGHAVSHEQVKKHRETMIARGYWRE